ncbi:hypothetical protein [Streptomyces sp. NPDC052701]|uniref:hypothetical protein n=1 Tax=Streptomyces sp. NPDC052701 TaxID=3155533 RepID=UPI00342A0E04
MEASSGPRTTVCVLVSVDSFDHPVPFAPIEGGKARNNVDRLADVLAPRRGRRTGRARRPAPRVLKVVNPAHPGKILNLLRSLADTPPDLLVFYYMGHGYLDPHDPAERDKFYLATRASSPEDISHTALSFRDLAGALRYIGAGSTVVILDCCFSGNFPSNALPEDRSFTVLASSRRGFLISPGEPGEPLTPFTAQLVRALGEGPRSLGALGKRLAELAQEPHNRPVSPYLPWHPVEVSVGNGAGTVLPPADDGPLKPPFEPPQRGPGLRERLRTLLRARRWQLALTALLLSVAALIGWHFLPGGSSSCPPPLELRMATAPEEVDALRQLVRAFEDTPLNHASVSGAQDCRTARFTVYGASLDALTGAFSDAERWGHGAPLAEVGPQPDVWVAQSSAAVSQVRARLVPPPGQRGDTFFDPVSLMTDRPVLVLTDPARRALGLAPAPDEPHRLTWKRLRGALAESPARTRPVLLRPNPTVSGVGLAHTLGMYAANGAGEFDRDSGLLPADRVHWLETEVISQGRSVAESAQALCALAEPDDTGGPGDGGAPVASGALVSGRQAALYAQRPAQYCSGDAEPDVHRYVLDGGPPLDYQLVSILWPADDRAERSRAVDAFRRWVRSEEGAGTVRATGFTPHEQDGFLFRLSDRDVADRLALFHAAHPELRLDVVFDITGSMRENDRFEAARTAVGEALNRLGEDDRYRLSVFPTGDDGTGLRKLTDGWQAVPPGGAELPLTAGTLRPRGIRQADLHHALRTVADGLETSPDDDRQHAVLLVTDGDFLNGSPPRTGLLAEVAEELRRRDVPVIVASMRPYGCAAERDTGILAEHSGGECEPLSGDLAATVSRHVAALTEGRQAR